MGLQQELKLSRDFHHGHIPVLISAQLLRARGLGQVDVCRLEKETSGWVVEIGEIKSSELGVEQMLRGQRGRLFGSLRFLTSLLGSRGKLTSLVGN